MWIFGYGSLMWDGWQAEFSCLQQKIATLHGYRRTFNKASVKNWGSPDAPCPTLNLEADAAGQCKGMAFEFAIDQEGEVMKYLKKREGKAFSFQRLPVRFEDDTQVDAYVPIYTGTNLIHEESACRKAAMVTRAKGTDGACLDYVKVIAETLAKLGIDDPAVTGLWHDVTGR